MTMTNITLAHGNGGQENNELITKIFYKAFKNDILAKSEDAAVIENGNLAFSTDSFTVSPIEFPGSNIGKLSICGTCNDLAMMGASPKYLTCSVIIEEGFDVKTLKRLVSSMEEELKINGAVVVSGDTKVVPKGSVDKIFINTTGIGEIKQKGISSNNIQEDDVILVSNSIGKHGATIFAAREGIDFSTNLKSDCASLWPVVEKLIDENIQIRALRDATRGGVSAVLNEWAKQSDICIEIEEEKIPVCDEVNGVCELLGFEALSLANEGTFVMAVSKEQVSKALEILKSMQTSKEAVVIGEVTSKHKGKVVLNTAWGTQRFIDLPTGELLPRIC
ncbi:hydrogenase expression/formation protein HypE [Halarcobacter anaerophilus]|uniref:Hydrogenase expression/formation protein HypE n=2 Tax=Halarcobacter anaerophilus TaxID=877500 RepID=A0A4Q0Y012_9BACT|nr:hydrogenase expression/formation protein HypE [Halarcobacter anaerophilus]RXJ63337.1 hydrogenase expression/formation protein HypE [Halarcobacter anaerophilus]